MKQPLDTPEQVTPVTEQPENNKPFAGYQFVEDVTGHPKETIADCGKKTLMDNPTIADHIGSHMNLAFGYAKELVNENTRLRAQLYRLPILEQENAQLKELNQSLAERNIYTIQNQTERIVELENKLNFANPQLLSLSQSNADLTKQVEELTQQVFNLKRLLKNYL